MRFEWDPTKEEANRKKHGVSFGEATKVFTSGANYLEIYDEIHSDKEDRFIAVGRIKRGVVVVVYVEREEDVLRILSARMATRQERKRFEEYEKRAHGKRDW